MTHRSKMLTRCEAYRMTTTDLTIRAEPAILERPRATTGRVELVHDRRPQEDRDHVRHDGDRSSSSSAASRRCSIRAPARATRRHHPLGRARTTSSSRCTARRWCSSWACRIAAAFGNYFLPLMIGARDVAFPRLNMLRVLGVPVRRAVPVLVVPPGFGGAPNGGWVGYAPLNSTPMSPGSCPGTVPTTGPSASSCWASVRSRPR